MEEKKIWIYCKMLNNCLDNYRNKSFLEFGITSSQADILLFLNHSQKEVNQREIEKLFHLTNPTVNGILNRLEAKGLIKRIIENTDHRKRIVKVTEKGKKLHQDVAHHAKVLEEILMKDITEEEIQIFIRVFERILNNGNVFKCKEEDTHVEIV